MPLSKITRLIVIPELSPGTSSAQVEQPVAGPQKSWRMWFALAVVVGIAIGVLLMYKPAPTQLEEAITLIHANKQAGALPILEEIVRKQPDNAEVYPWLAQCYLRTDRLAEGRTALDTALKLKLPGTLTAPVVLSYAEFYESKNDFAEAEKLFASAQAAVPEKDLTAGKALLYMNWSDADANAGYVQAALDHLKAAFELLPVGDENKAMLPHKIGEYYRQLAAVAETEGKDEHKAISLLKDSLNWCDEPATRIALGGLYVRNNRLADAVDNYKVVTQQDGNNLEARHHLVDLFVQTKDLQGAQAALLELTEKERSVENFDMLSTINTQLNNYAGAVRALEDAIMLRPNDIPLLIKLHDTLVTWNGILTRQGQTDEAMSVKGHADRVADLLKSLQGIDDKAATNGFLQGNPPVSLVTSRIWLAKGSFTPEGEIRFKNISGQPVTDLTFNIVFFDHTSNHQNGSVTVTTASKAHPLPPDAIASAYFSCPNIVKAEHQLAVIILWKGHFLKELPVVKER